MIATRLGRFRLGTVPLGAFALERAAPPDQAPYRPPVPYRPPTPTGWASLGARRGPDPDAGTGSRRAGQGVY